MAQDGRDGAARALGRLWARLLWLGHAGAWVLGGGRHTRLSDRLGRRYLAAWRRYWR